MPKTFRTGEIVRAVVGETFAFRLAVKNSFASEAVEKKNKKASGPLP